MKNLKEQFLEILEDDYTPSIEKADKLLGLFGVSTMKRPKAPKEEVLQQLGVVPVNLKPHVKELNLHIDELEQQNAKLIEANGDRQLRIQQLEDQLKQALK